jgi:hypothetical protein
MSGARRKGSSNPVLESFIVSRNSVKTMKAYRTVIAHVLGTEADAWLAKGRVDDREVPDRIGNTSARSRMKRPKSIRAKPIPSGS